MKNTFTIGQMYGEAFNCAVINVGKILGKDEEASRNGWYKICEIASKFGVRFDENDEIVKD